MRSTHGLGWRNESGQVMPFVTILLPTLLLFVALVVNVGQAVNRRVAVQFLADTSAWTGATVLAVHLNRMAWLNDKIQLGWVVTKTGNGFFYLSPQCVTGDPLVEAYQGLTSLARPMMTFLNGTSKFRAIRAASGVAFGETGNLPELFPGESETDFGHKSYTTSGTVLSLSPNAVDIEEVPDGSNPVAVWDSWLVSGEKSTWWLCLNGEIPNFRSADFDLWYRATSEPEKFVTHITAPEVPARLFPGIFGRLPEMSAVAAAIPEGGDIEKGRAKYVVKMVPVGMAWPVDPLLGPLHLKRFVFH